MKSWLRWNEVQKQTDLASFAEGPAFSMSAEGHAVLPSKGLLMQFELLEGNYPQNFLVLFILLNNAAMLIEVHDYQLAALLVNKRIQGRLVDDGLVKASAASLYLLCDDAGLHHLDAHKLHHQHQGIQIVAEELPDSLKHVFKNIKKKKISRTKIFHNRLFFIEQGNLMLHDFETGKKIASRKVTKRFIADFDCGGDYVFCACTGGNAACPDPYSEVVALDANTLEILCRIPTEYSSHRAIACTSDGSRVACHDREASLQILRCEQHDAAIEMFACIKNYCINGRPDLLRFSPDHNWLFWGNHGGIQTLISKNVENACYSQKQSIENYGG